VVAQASNQRGKEVRPEDKMATDSKNGDIITLSIGIHKFDEQMKQRNHKLHILC
jgi:hypothetical protein